MTLSRRSRPMTFARGAAVLILSAASTGCRDKGYSQASPEAVLVTARRMVENGDAPRLSELIYAESPQMRRLLRDAGRTLGLLDELGRAVQQRFPKEVESLRAEAAEAARTGQASSFVGRLVGAAGPGRRGRPDPAAAQEARAAFDRTIKELFADPYAWLTRNADRLRATTEGMPDGMAAIQWDSNPDADDERDWKPILPPLGMAMKQDRGRWYVMLPTGVPGASAVVPKSPEEWEIASSLLEAVDNMLMDLRKDVVSGRVATLDDVARSAGEKAFIPVALGMMAYGKAMDERRKGERAASPSQQR